GLRPHAGSLAVSGDGATVALAGFSAGLYCYRLDGPPHRWLPLASLCRLAALRHDGRCILVASQANELLLADLQAKVRDTYNLPAPAPATGPRPVAARAA